MIGKAMKRHFQRLVSDAYDHPNRKSHRRIREAARVRYGATPGGALRRRWSELFIDCVYQAQLALFREGHDLELGAAPIGFEDLKLRCRSSDANSSVIYLYGFSDNLTYFPLYRSCVRAGSVAIDVGANLGIHSLVLSRCVGARGTVIAYEPSRTIHDRLLQNIRENGVSNIVPRNFGLWEKPGRIGFDPCLADFNIGKGTIHGGAPLEVPVTTLDEQAAGFGGRIDLIKIDVEGAELSVLKGARGVLAEHRPILIIEFNPGRYSIRDVIDQVPFDCRLYVLPHTLREPFAPIGVADFDRQVDVLIVPSDRDFRIGPDHGISCRR